MIRWLALLLAGLGIQAGELPTRGQIQAIAAELAEITGLPLKREVPVSKMSRRQLERYLDKRIRKSAKPAEIRADELTLKWLGLVPPDFDLAQSTIDLLTEQAAAFYDYKKKKLVLLENPLGEFDQFILAHELAHALADQHFPIGKFMDDRAVNDDESTARMAVVEGQASWLMTEFEMRHQRLGSLLDDDAALPRWNSLDPGNSYAYPVLEKAPLYLKVSLLFPYWEGGRFQQAVLKRRGRAAFREVFENPPSTTQNILRPETYFAGRSADTPELPKEDARGWKTLTKGTFGELDHLIVFRLIALADAEELASQWRGGAYHVLESKQLCCRVLYASRWSTPEAAERARAAWEQHAKQKAVRGTLTTRREDRDVIAIEHPPAKARAASMQQSP
jgi:hypothetical protein